MKELFGKYLTKESVVLLRSNNKLSVMDELIDRAADISKLDRDLISRLTWKRERMMTTGVGLGLGMPHIRVNNIPYPVILVGVAETPIADYLGQDEKPVQVIVFIAAPDADQEAYLKLLGSVSRRMREVGMIDSIIANMNNSSKILELLGANEQ